MWNFEIPCRFPSLNEIIGKARAHWSESARQKKVYTKTASWAIKDAQTNGDLPLKPILGPVTVSFVWFEPKPNRDVDNIMAGQKFILDALVQCKVLAGDSQRYVTNVHHKFAVANPPKVSVEIHQDGVY